MHESAIAALVDARWHAPFEVLGVRRVGSLAQVRVWLPAAESARIVGGPRLLASMTHRGVFEWRGPCASLPPAYRVAWCDAGRQRVEMDAYQFRVALDGKDIESFIAGTHLAPQRFLGAHHAVIRGIAGVRFSVWAPHAERVSVVGDFNAWDGRRHPLQHQAHGIWVLFVPELDVDTPYKFEIRHRDSDQVQLRSDPFGTRFEAPPQACALVTDERAHVWTDDVWMMRRATIDWRAAPLSIYEVHLPSWRELDGGLADPVAVAHALASHVRELGFTHIELLPIMEHPFGGSWGYQVLGYYALTHRIGAGDPAWLTQFVDCMHGHGIGVLLDWVPAHFPLDDHGLAWFDGQPLFEYPDARRGRHPDWHTAVFDYGRPQVRSFLIGSALHWLERFHIDGLRVDAVASMLHLDYSRGAGQWVPNEHGGREHLEAIEFLRHLNETIRARVPGALVIAEESTQWPMVTGPVYAGGLGFTCKWNMGWMHDVLGYLQMDPVFRSHHHHRLTFAAMYAHTEHFVLTLSHDEVVHGKSSLLHKMAGDDWQKFAHLRLLFCLQFTFPGKKLVFMGGEIGQRREWDHDGFIDWQLLAHAPHEGVFRVLRALAMLYRDHPALHADADTFAWLDCHDHANSVIAFRRSGGGRELVIVLNFTPVVRYGYRIGVDRPGTYVERINTDSACFAGSNVGNLGCVVSKPEAWMSRPFCLDLTLPPLGGLVLEQDPATARGDSTTGGGWPPQLTDTTRD